MCFENTIYITPNYKIFLINSRSLKYVVSLVNYIKSINYLYYHFKNILSFYPLNYFFINV